MKECWIKPVNELDFNAKNWCGNMYLCSYESPAMENYIHMIEYSEYEALNQVYIMNREWIRFVKDRIRNVGFVTEQDFIDYQNSIKKELK